MAETDVVKIEILRLTKDYVIINKPAGYDSEKDVPLLLEQDGIKNAKCFHRLDRDVGGVMLLTLSDRAPKILSETEFEKEYFALVNGILPEEEGEMRDLLYHDRRLNKTFVVKKKRNGVKEAFLTYKVIFENNGKSGVSVILGTGRTHQIRVQFASRGFPLVGDGKYGGGKGKPSLVSKRLGFFDKMNNEDVNVEIDVVS